MATPNTDQTIVLKVLKGKTVSKTYILEAVGDIEVTDSVELATEPGVMGRIGPRFPRSASFSIRVRDDDPKTPLHKKARDQHGLLRSLIGQLLYIDARASPPEKITWTLENVKASDKNDAKNAYDVAVTAREIIGGDFGEFFTPGTTTGLVPVTATDPPVLGVGDQLCGIGSLQILPSSGTEEFAFGPNDKVRKEAEIVGAGGSRALQNAIFSVGAALPKGAKYDKVWMSRMVDMTDKSYFCGNETLEYSGVGTSLFIQYDWCVFADGGIRVTTNQKYCTITCGFGEQLTMLVRTTDDGTTFEDFDAAGKKNFRIAVLQGREPALVLGISQGGYTYHIVFGASTIIDDPTWHLRRPIPEITAANMKDCFIVVFRQAK